MNSNLKRCWNTEDPLYVRYHDEEWGVPVHDDKKLFEFLVLDAFQAGLSWLIILKKREAFRKAFDYFNPESIAKFTEKDVDRLMKDPSIVRNRNKILASIKNARCFLEVQREFGTLTPTFGSLYKGRRSRTLLVNYRTCLLRLQNQKL